LFSRLFVCFCFCFGCCFLLLFFFRLGEGVMLWGVLI
jgi:hypothetical protein